MGIVVLLGGKVVYKGVQCLLNLIERKSPYIFPYMNSFMAFENAAKIWNTILNEDFFAALSSPNAIGESFQIPINSPIGVQDTQKIHSAIRDVFLFKVLLQYGMSFESLLGILNEVLGVYEGKTSSFIQSVSLALLSNDPISSIKSVFTGFGSANGATSIYNVLVEGAQDLQLIALKLLNNDVLQSLESLSVGLSSDEGIIALNSIISEGFQRISGIETTLSDSAESIQNNILDLSNMSDLFQIQKVMGSLYELQAKFSSVPYKIYLDGVDISNLVEGNIEIERSQDSIHNSISFSSISDELFEKADPTDLYGEVRIEVHIGNTVMFFLLEEKSHTSDGKVSYWGRDATARDDSPYSPSITVQLTEPTSAKDVCETFLPDMKSVIDWEILDWVLPITFESTGTPIEIISSIASEIGAIVRAQEDGSLKIRYVNSIRPIYLSDGEYAASYYGNDVYNVSYEMEYGGGYTSVVVTADTNDKTSPILELEDPIGDERMIGEDTYIRAYYFEDPPISSDPTILFQDVTDGSIIFLSVEVEEHTEVIVFQEGVGSSQYPLKNFKNIAWFGRTGSIKTWDEYSTDITLETTENCIAEVTYDAEYYRYKAYGHAVEELLAYFEIKSSFFSSVKVLMPDDSVQGEEILTSYLTSLAALTRRGEIWLDQNKYNEETVTFESPYVDGIRDGAIVWLEADRVLSGKYQVYSSGISINGPKVANTLTVKRWQV